MLGDQACHKIMEFLIENELSGKCKLSGMGIEKRQFGSKWIFQVIYSKFLCLWD